MKITKNKLKQIIKEEIETVAAEEKAENMSPQPFKATGEAKKTTLREAYANYSLVSKAFVFPEKPEDIWVIVDPPIMHLGEEEVRAHKLGTNDWGDFRVDMQVIVLDFFEMSI